MKLCNMKYANSNGNVHHTVCFPSVIKFFRSHLKEKRHYMPRHVEIETEKSNFEKPESEMEKRKIMRKKWNENTRCTCTVWNCLCMFSCVVSFTNETWKKTAKNVTESGYTCTRLVVQYGLINREEEKDTWKVRSSFRIQDYGMMNDPQIS
jgi:hypothetical protein